MEKDDAIAAIKAIADEHGLNCYLSRFKPGDDVFPVSGGDGCQWGTFILPQIVEEVGVYVIFGPYKPYPDTDCFTSDTEAKQECQTRNAAKEKFGGCDMEEVRGSGSGSGSGSGDG